MPRVERTITINAPIETVYSLIADHPERMAEWWPPIEMQQRISPPPTQVGSVSRYVYNMLGIKIKGEHRVEAMQRNQHLHVKTTSGLTSGFYFHFSVFGENATCLTISVEYQLPGAIVGQLFNKSMLENENVKGLEFGLANLKSILESNRS